MKIYVCVSDCGVGMVSMGVRKGEVFLSSMKDGFSPAPENFPIRINIETKRGLQTCLFFFFLIFRAANTCSILYS